MLLREITDIVVEETATDKIYKFYENMYKYNKHVFSREDVNKLVITNIKNAHNIIKGVPCKDPIMDKWKGYLRVRYGSWNYEIKIIDNVANVVDACHGHNLTNHYPLNTEEEQTYVNPRITDITLRERRDNRFLIKCKIDGEEQLFEVVTDTDSNLYRAKQITPEQLAEKYFKNALDQSIDLDHIVHFKR